MIWIRLVTGLWTFKWPMNGHRGFCDSPKVCIKSVYRNLSEDQVHSFNEIKSPMTEKTLTTTELRI